MTRRICRYLGGWCALALAWAAGVAALVADRIGDQIAASQDLARDIAALDGGGAGPALVTRWQDVVALVVEHRAPLLLQIVVLPPLAVLAAAMLGLAWWRWAPRSLRPAATRPRYAAPPPRAPNAVPSALPRSAPR